MEKKNSELFGVFIVSLLGEIHCNQYIFYLYAIQIQNIHIQVFREECVVWGRWWVSL